MSIKVMTKVWEWSRAEGTGLLVMLALADHADDQGYCYPGVERIAEKCRIGTRTAQRYIREMADKGELIIEEGMGIPVNGGRTNRYRINVRQRPPTSAVVRDKSKGGVNLTPGVTPDREGGVTAVSPKPSVEPSVCKGADASSILSKYPVLDTIEFHEAWNDWLQYRSKKRLPRYTTDQQLKRLSLWGPDRSIAAIEYSITQEFQGIHEERQVKPGTNQRGDRNRNEGTFNEGKSHIYAGAERLARTSSSK